MSSHNYSSLRADVSYFLSFTRKRDVFITASLIVFQYPEMGFKFRLGYIHVNSELMLYSKQGQFVQKKLSLLGREKLLFTIQ